MKLKPYSQFFPLKHEDTAQNTLVTKESRSTAKHFDHKVDNRLLYVIQQALCQPAQSSSTGGSASSVPRPSLITL